jgi:hypothetical protein
MATVGRPFPKGVSGNPGGRPKSLSRKTRELVGGDGEPLIRLWLSIATDERQKTTDRLAARANATGPLGTHWDAGEKHACLRDALALSSPRARAYAREVRAASGDTRRFAPGHHSTPTDTRKRAGPLGAGLGSKVDRR